ncbi:hypothetical protein DFQ28_001966 [Apophysomyces sp. BC1034]|nr:hypothetical protein DFQ30_002370 [Apophysomyces sp. BC1015]KAG0179905.1 hypothetical protein DFQ29_001485 [Apophysomyces sp. BC1021]KAG0190493.1 hypothetical protein DFQ28_001966 [Apophysomyces sp. BC1034]
MTSLNSQYQRHQRSVLVDLDLDFDAAFLRPLTTDSTHSYRQQQPPSPMQASPTSAMELDAAAHVNPWQPTNPRSYPSIESLMSTSSYRPYLRELVDKYLVTEHDDCATIECKNNTFHDYLCMLVAEYTRPKQRTNPDGIQQMDDEAAKTTEQLCNTTVPSDDRRRLLRERGRIRESRTANTSFHQYRHRPKLTYDNYVNPTKRLSWSIAPDELRAYFNQQYGPPSVPTVSASKALPSSSLGSIDADLLDHAFKRFNKSSFSEFDTSAYLSTLLYFSIDTDALETLANNPTVQKG